MAPEPYRSLGSALDQAGLAQPVLLIDRNRLDANLALAANHLPAQKLRLVVKSLPSLPLLEHAMAALGSRRLMSFHRPFLQAALAHFDAVDILLGKPLPVAALRRVLEDCQGPLESRLDQVQWLIDSPLRLQQYLEVARTFDTRLRINIEINVGMQRGGLESPAELQGLVGLIENHPRHLQLSGLMGYDAHAAKAPGGDVAGALQRSNQRYRQFIDALPSAAGLTLNGAGSPTHTLHSHDSPLNDISLGSVLLKPSGFDLPQLEEYQPACWIATPTLKRRAGVTVPYLGPLTRPLSKLPGLRRDSVFLYGGRWMASPDWPRGMRPSRWYGLSSNQQMMTIPAASDLAVDDWVFFRPTQAEAVLLQFGPIRVIRDGVLRDQWPVLQND